MRVVAVLSLIACLCGCRTDSENTKLQQAADARVAACEASGGVAIHYEAWPWDLQECRYPKVRTVQPSEKP